MEQDVLTYPTQGCVDGVNGDHILLAPPFIIASEECQLAARAIADAMKSFSVVLTCGPWGQIQRS